MAIRNKLIIVLSVLLFALGLEACDKENAIAPEISYKKSSNLQTWEKYKNSPFIPAGTNISFRDDFDGGWPIPNSFWTLCRPEVTNENDPVWNRFFKNTKNYECVRVEDGYLKLTAKKEKGPAG